MIRKLWQYPSLMEVKATPFAETPHADAFIGYHPDYLFRPKDPKYLYPYSTYFVNEFPVTAPVLSNESVNIVFNKTVLYSMYHYTVPQQFNETIYIDKWRGNDLAYIWGPKEKRHLYPSFFFQINTFPEFPHVDAFQGSKPDKIFDVQRLQYLFPKAFNVFQVTDINFLGSLNNYYPSRIDGKKPQQHLYPSTFYVEVVGGNKFVIRHLPKRLARMGRLN